VVCLIAGGTAAAVTVTRGGHAAGSSADCPNGTVEVVVRADPAAAGWLHTLANRYIAAHHHIDNKCVVPLVSTLGYAGAGQVVRDTPFPGGGTPPDVWVPDSLTAFDLLRAQNDSAAVLPKTAKPIATSPLVLAAPAQTVTQWQEDGAGRDLNTLLNVGSSDAAAISTPDPATTGTGLAAVIAATATVTGKNTISSDTFRSSNAQLGLLRLRSRMSNTASDGQTLLNKVGSQASADNMVAVAERDVWQYNKSHPSNRLESFNAFGAARAVDFPYVVLQAPWVSDRIKRAAVDFQSWLGSSPIQNSLTEFGLRQADGTAGSLAGPGIDGAHGRLDPAADAGSVASAHSAWTLLTTLRSVLSLIDVSASMAATVPGTSQSKLELARDTALGALPYFTPDDAVGLSEFSSSFRGGGDYRELVPLGTASANASQRATLKTAYQSLSPQSGTALYDSVLKAFDDAGNHYLPGAVNVIVLLSDGDDANSKISLATLLSELQKRQDPSQPVHIITIAYGADADASVLKQIAAATGGASFAAPDPRSIGTVYISALAALAN